MKQWLFFLVVPVLFASCGGDSWNDSSYFSYDLVGKWESAPIGYFDYWGVLEIDYNKITITGYSGYGPSTPFAEFTRNVPLEGYSEEGKIFIKDRGSWQAGLPYAYWKDAVGGGHLTFTFGGREETLHKE
ncbi:MAG: hypothetical protein LBT16_01455 [Treponema sp.]|jgi:hypothetical protein|nr:hypothetical protein [Treponema sp.]